MNVSFAQNKSANEDIQNSIADTAVINAYVKLAFASSDPDTMTKYISMAREMSKSIGYKEGEVNCILAETEVYFAQGNIGQSIQQAKNALRHYEEMHNAEGIASACLSLQGIHWAKLKEYQRALLYAHYGESVSEKYNVIGNFQFPGQRLAPLYLAEIAQIYVLMGNLDSAMYYTNKSISFDEKFNGASWSFPFYLLATIKNMQGDYETALTNYHKAKQLALENNLLRDTLQINSGLSSLYTHLGKTDSAIYYSRNVIDNWNNISEPKNLLEAILNLGNVYKRIAKPDSALKYIELGYQLKDSIFSEESRNEVQNIAFNEQLQRQEAANRETAYKGRLQKLALIGGLISLLLIVGILWRSVKQKQKSYDILEKQEIETEVQKTKAERALEQLKATQTQLIQSEKMASLGELTAGIAHEIQNPLNFVNNFSEVNKELIEELKKAIESGNHSETKSLAISLDKNMEKITEHGKRVDAIVKSMLQHTRTSTGQKEPTDINLLAEEYLRLSYHGMRAKEKNFTIILDTIFDEHIGNINIIPQDIAKVLLNIYNNAFYAVSKKSRKEQKEYEPKITVTTSLENAVISNESNQKWVVISVTDNGNGIPHNVIEKIFHPFYTTKPTGEGPGLGLSLSYDIIKAHGGNIDVKSKEGEGTCFSISIPL